MIKRNEELENELIRYRKKISQLESHLAQLEDSDDRKTFAVKGGGSKP